MTLNRLQCDVAISYGIRNRGAHDVGTAAAIWTNFGSVQRAILRVLCATIDYLY